MSAAKKVKTYSFHEEWELDFLFTSVNDKCVCLICGFSVAVGKRCNVERHFTKLHGNFPRDFPTGSALRREKRSTWRKYCGPESDCAVSGCRKAAGHGYSEDFSTKEEFLTLLPLKTTTRGIDIYNAVKNYLVEKKVPIERLVLITSDGAPAMTGRHSGFIAHCKSDPDFPKFLNYHCIIHQQAICAKVLDFDHVMGPVVKIINSIRAKAKRHRSFKLFLEECDANHGDLLLHTNVRWLSREYPWLQQLSVDVFLMLSPPGHVKQQATCPEHCDMLFVYMPNECR
ncbi:hypothetical protein WMY93_015733 [Mugilogobius chulae]|uniref:Uncharacterized protein n=1 Tax=Mugilogobius chulae TaxID=88201 RepID=A0AAW0NVP7_9GOBI